MKPNMASEYEAQQKSTDMGRWARVEHPSEASEDVIVLALYVDRASAEGELSQPPYAAAPQSAMPVWYADNIARRRPAPGERCPTYQGHVLAPRATESTSPHGRLVDYNTTAIIRAATAEEQRASQEQAKRDGGAGVIDVDGRRCYVED